MRPVDWGHVALALEWSSLFLVTPEFLGGKRSRSIATLLQKGAIFIVMAPSVLTLGPFQSKPPLELVTEADKVWADLKKRWKESSLVRNILIGLLLPAPVLILAFVALNWPWKWLPIGLFVVGHINFAFIVHKKYYILQLFRVPIVGVFLGFFLGVPVMFATAFSLSVDFLLTLPFGIAGIALIKVADENRLRSYLFIIGVLTFTVSKVIQFALVR